MSIAAILSSHSKCCDIGFLAKRKRWGWPSRLLMRYIVSWIRHATRDSGSEPSGETTEKRRSSERYMGVCLELTILGWQSKR